METLANLIRRIPVPTRAVLLTLIILTGGFVALAQAPSGPGTTPEAETLTVLETTRQMDSGAYAVIQDANGNQGLLRGNYLAGETAQGYPVDSPAGTIRYDSQDPTIGREFHIFLDGALVGLFISEAIFLTGYLIIRSQRRKERRSDEIINAAIADEILRTSP